MDLKTIIGHFSIQGDVITVEPFGGGHINDTFRIHCVEQNYLLQKVNRYVFRDIKGLMNNIDLVTNHIRQKLIDEHSDDINQRSLQVIKTKSGDLYFEDEENQCWRIFNFIENHIVYDRAPNQEIAYEGAKAFGLFLSQLSDLDPKHIVDTIPNFHNIIFRLENLEKAISRDPVNRVKQVKKEIEYARKSVEIMTVIYNLGKKGIIPVRIVHNDTKINNVLFSKENKGLCVTDLDTVMAGFAHYDFGDVIRTGATTADEDEEDLAKVNYDLGMFEAFSMGFLENTTDILNKEEIDTFAHAALLFPFIMGIRFLTDYIEGDVYYKIKHPEHNLTRARAQLKLAADGEAKLKDMQHIIHKLISKK